MKLALLPTTVLLILVAGPIEQPIAGLSPLESFAKGFVFGLFKSLKGAKLREAGRRRTFSGSASADLSFGGHVSPLGSSSQDGWRGSRIDLSGNLDVQGKKYPITHADGRRTIRKQYDGTVTFDANFTRLSPPTTTVAPVMNVVPVVQEIVTQAPQQEVFIKPESQEIFITQPEPEPEPITSFGAEAEAILPPVEEIAPVVPPIEETPEFVASVDEVSVPVVDSRPQTIIVTDLDSLPETGEGVIIKITQSNDNLSHLKGGFNLNVANTGSGTGAVIHINQGSGISPTGTPSSVLELPVDDTSDDVAIFVDTGSISTSFTDEAVVDSESTTGDDYALESSGVSLPDYDEGTPSDGFVEDGGGSAPVMPTYGRLPAPSESGSSGFESFFNGESVNGDSGAHGNEGTEEADYISGVEAPASATVGDYSDGEILDAPDYPDAGSPAPVVPEFSVTPVVSAPPTTLNAAVGFLQNGHVMLPNGKLYSVKKAPLLYKYSDVIESPHAIQPGSVPAQGTGASLDVISETTGVDIHDSVSAVVGGGVDAAAGGGVDVAVDGGVDVAVDGGVDVAVDGGVDVAVDGGVDAVDGGAEIAPDALYSPPVDAIPAGEYVVETLSQAEGTTGADVDTSVSVSGAPPNLYPHYVQANVASLRELSNIALKHGNGLPLIIRLRTRHRVSTPALSKPVAAQNIAIGSLQNGHVVMPTGELYAAKKAPLLYKSSDVIESPDAIQVESIPDHSTAADFDTESNAIEGASAAKSLINAHADTNTIPDNTKMVRKDKPQQIFNNIPSNKMSSSTEPAKNIPQAFTPGSGDSTLQFLAKFAEAHRLSMLRDAQGKNSASAKMEAAHSNPSVSLNKGRTMNRHSTFEGEAYRDRLHEVLSESGIEQRSLTHFRRTSPGFVQSAPRAPAGTSHGKSASVTGDPVPHPAEVSSLDRKENSGITRAKLQYRQRQVVPSPQA